MTSDSERARLIGGKPQETVELLNQGQFNAAEVLCRDILQLDPRQFDALQFLGAIAAQRNNLELAVEMIGQALAINPNHAPTHFNRGRILQALYRHDSALAAFDAALALVPALAEAHGARGQALFELRRYQDAVAACDRSIELQAGDPVVHNTRAGALTSLRQLAAAVESYDRAVALAPNYAEAYVNRGHALRELGRFEAAASSFDAALQLAPDFPFARCPRLQARLQACLWDNLKAETEDIKAKVMRGERITLPFYALVLSDDLPFQKRAAETWTQAYHPPLA